MSSVRGSARPHPADQLFQRAVGEFQRGQFVQSEALCRDILAIDQRHSEALHLLGLSALQQGSAARAITLLRESLAIAPQRPVVHTNLAIALLMEGDPTAALASCEVALAMRPDYAEAHNARGNALLAKGQPAEALASYTRASQLKPNLAALHSNCGNALRDLGRSEEALERYQRALQIDSNLREALLGSAGILRQLGRHADALVSLTKVLARSPNDVDALHERAKISIGLGELDQGLQTLERALALQPRATGPLLDRGNLLFQLERIGDALASYDAVLALKPDDSDALFNRANALLRLQREEEALQSFDTCIALKPDLARAHHFRGNTLRRLRRPADALESFARAVAIDHGYVEALNGMGDAYRDLERLPEAIQSYSRALEVDPEGLLTLTNLSRALLTAKRSEEAVEYLERLLAISPDGGPEFRHALGNLHHSRILTCNWRDYDATVAAIDAGVLVGKHVTTPALYTASGGSPEIHLRCARLYAQKKWGDLGSPTWTRDPYRHDKPRVAYISADFREHPVAYLMAGIFERHDHTRFEITGVSLTPPDTGALGQRVRRAFPNFIEAAARSDEEVVRLLQEREIDIAVDLTGYTTGYRTGIFARRAAPIQVNYLGYSATTGAPFIDYMIADAVVVPEKYRAFYSENVVHLPCYLPPGDKRGIAPPLTRAEYGLPEQGFVFCAHHLCYKITPHVFAVWMRLLRAVDGSVLWLPMSAEGAMRNLRAEATNQGVDPGRLIFAPRVPDTEDYLARFAAADLFLDTIPYNAHTTTSDALWAGLPVLTCQGHSFAGRVAASLLSSLGLHELITDSLEAYEARARELAESPARLSKLRTQLQSQRDSHPLFDADYLTRQLESAYTTMWEAFEHRTHLSEVPAPSR